MPQNLRRLSGAQIFLFSSAIGVLFFSLGVNAIAQSRPVKLRRGQVVALQLLENLDSKTAHTGDKVPLKLTRDLVTDGITVLPKDPIIYGRITSAHASGNNCQDGEVKWRVESITLATGQKVKTQFTPGYIYPFGLIPDRVSLPSAGRKIGGRIVKASEIAALAPVVVGLSPLMVPLGIFAREPCDGKHGDDKVIDRDQYFFLAVSKTVKIVR